MMTLRVDEVGPATSVQDIGRFGAQRYGLGTAGALDRYSLAAANTLVNQPATAAAIEIGPFATRFTALEGPVRLALAGAERDATIVGRRISLAQTVLLGPGETLSLGFAGRGVFTYLAVEGGIPGKSIFGSLSVHALAGLGSPLARPLQPGDELKLPFARSTTPNRELRLLPREDGPIRVVLGPQDDYFLPKTIEQFLSADWRISATSDRMGYRLDGPRLSHAKGHNIVSDGTANGHIQIPGSGQPLVLLADRGTTGGYPKIACIMTADLGRFAQSSAGSIVRFQAVSVEAAQFEAKRFAASITAMGDEMRTGLFNHSAEGLLSANLSGHAVSAMDPHSWLGGSSDEAG
jgi:biotin-dependent carboxylase-like uncharacterized protein